MMASNFSTVMAAKAGTVGEYVYVWDKLLTVGEYVYVWDKLL